MFNAHPVSTTCPHCDAFVTTRTTRKSSHATHRLSCLLCILCFPLAWIPYVTRYKATTSHTCPECNSMIGSFRPNSASSLMCCDCNDIIHCCEHYVECCCDDGNGRTDDASMRINGRHRGRYSDDSSSDSDCVECISGFCSD